jgi:hypothetical protein
MTRFHHKFDLVHELRLRSQLKGLGIIKKYKQVFHGKESYV